MPKFIYDLEIFPNFFLAAFQEPSEEGHGQITLFRWEERKALIDFLKQPDLVLAGYNNHNFDDQLLKGVLSGEIKSLDDLYEATEVLISREERNGWLRRLWQSWRPWLSIDLMQILGGRRAGSLKEHEIRLGLLNVQDLPIAPGTKLTEEQKDQITAYCANDIHATARLYFDLTPRIEVRRKVNDQYPALKGAALQQSDARIAEAVMLQQLAELAGFDKKESRPSSGFAFDPAERIDKAVSFSRPGNKGTLTRLRDLGVIDPCDWKHRYGHRFIFDTGRHQISLTQGGLHTPQGSAVIRSPNILEFDVSSYYPSLLLKGDRQPESLPHKWIEIVRGLTAQRLAAKATGDKTTADVFKIIINSLYGKLNDPYSINFDPSLQLQVVLNGQLFLLMLMESFESAGFSVIAANTDGLYIDGADRADEAISVAQGWETATGFVLERKTASIYASTSVNDYALFHPDKGWFHRKGRFADTHGKSPIIIHSAALAYLSSATPVEQTIGREHGILPFLYSRSLRGGNVTQNGQPLQRTNRWYKGIQNGAPILVERPGKKPSKVPGSEGAVVCNTLQDLNVPDDLDSDYYAQQANDLIAELLASDPAEPGVSKRTKDIRRAQAMGLVIVPKGLSAQPKANIPNTFHPDTVNHWKNYLANEGDWGEYEGYGSYTGAEFGVVAVDIDDLPKAKASGLFNYIAGPSMVAWHGSVTSADVWQGNARGTILFQYDGLELKTTNASFLKNFGFEILYGKRVVQLAGWHVTNEQYHWAGSLKPLPNGLLEMLTWLLPDDRASEAAADEEPGSVEQLDAFRKLANEDERYLTIAGELTWAIDKQDRVHLKGRCVGHDLHSDPSQRDPMKVSFWRGEIRVNCFHRSCEQTRTAWRDRMIAKLIAYKPVKLPPEKIVVETEHREVWAALHDKARSKLIVAATGGGKTYGTVLYICSRLEETEHLGKGKWDKFVVLCSSKDQMRQIGERFTKILDSTNINEHGIDLIEAEESLTIGKARSINEIRDTTRVAVTHYTYASRRQFSPYYYKFLDFIDGHTHVFIDEVDAFIASQTTSIQLGSRYKRVGKPSIGISKNVRLHKCGMHSGSNNCLNCIMHKYDGNMVSVDQYGVPVLAPRNEFIDADKNKQLEHVEIDHLQVGAVTVGTSQIRMLKQEDDPGPMRFWNPIRMKEDGLPATAPTFSEMFYDHLKSGYLPTVHRPIILFDEQQIDRIEIVRKYQEGATGRNLMIPEKEKSRIKFPSRPCNVLTLTMIDRRPITHMAKAKSVTVLTATLTSMHERFLSDALGELARSDIQPRQELRLDKIMVVGYCKAIPAKQIVRGRWQFRKLLRFRETQIAAEREYAQLRLGSYVVRFAFNRTDYRVNVEHVDQEHSILLTYSLSTLGRGIDLPQYDVVSVNGRIFKPISAYVTNDPHKVRDLIFEDRCNTILQNVGRVLRRPERSCRAEKVIVLENIETEEELNYIADKIGGMAIEPVERWWVPPYIPIEEVCDWLTKICLSHSLPAETPTGPQDVLAEALKLVAAGCSKKEIKLKLRWPVVRKTTDPNELAEIELKVDAALKARAPDVRRAKLKSPEKVEKARERRRKKIADLISRGKSDAQIRNDMKVDDKKHGWSEEDVAWFNEVLELERGRPLAAE